VPDTCAICGGPNRPGHIPSPADAVAASICWLTQQRDALPSVTDRMAQRRRHPDGKCRYCGMKQADKLAVTKMGLAHETIDPRWTSWGELPPNVQFARVCEAQAPSWLDAMPAE